MGYTELEKLNAEVLTISVDSVFAHKVWDETELAKMTKGNMPFPMLADQTGKISRLYEVYDEDAGICIRGRYLIDPQGIIQAAEVLTAPVGRNLEELVRQIRAFQYHQKSGEVTPQGWTPGCPTLRPATGLTNRVSHEWKPGQKDRD